MTTTPTKLQCLDCEGWLLRNVAWSQGDFPGNSQQDLESTQITDFRGMPSQWSSRVRPYLFQRGTPPQRPRRKEPGLSGDCATGLAGRFCVAGQLRRHKLPTALSEQDLDTPGIPASPPSGELPTFINPSFFLPLSPRWYQLCGNPNNAHRLPRQVLRSRPEFS